jgi:hypothetical protein
MQLTLLFILYMLIKNSYTHIQYTNNTPTLPTPVHFFLVYLKYAAFRLNYLWRVKQAANEFKNRAPDSCCCCVSRHNGQRNGSQPPL